MQRSENSDTIIAIATPPGRGGVSIVRLSGPSAYSIAQKLTHREHLQPRIAFYGSLWDVDGALIDTGLTLYFKSPHSFTGEDVIEFQLHGSPVVMDYLLQVCTQQGVRLARPGEFSERAFLNDKIDLAQAEAIADLIDASSLTAARMAMRSLQGVFSEQIHALHDRMVHLRMYVEAAIDFPEEEVDFLADGHIATALALLLEDLRTIRNNTQQGIMMREGLSIVIAGRPNAGKSTLINQLAKREVAIVTPIAGTTRDIMREHILIDDIPVHIIDTAGLRESDDLVEQEGIRRAWQEVSRADCVIFIQDITTAAEDLTLFNALKAQVGSQVPIISVYNKIDVEPQDNRDPMHLYLSAKTGDGLDALKTAIKQQVGYQPTEGQFIARRRHLEALDSAYQYLLTGQQQLNEHRAGELLAEDLRLAHQSLATITGTFTADDLLGVIFSSFCIGK